MGNKIAISSQQTPKKPVVKKGDPSSKDELQKWYNTPSFGQLDKRGQEAFFKFLRGGAYKEDADIVNIPIDADGMGRDAKRYQFWIKCPETELCDLLEVYVVDEETKLVDARDVFDFREKKKEEASSLQKYLQMLKDRMKPDLDEQFKKFKTYLVEEYAKTFD